MDPVCRVDRKEDAKADLTCWLVRMADLTCRAVPVADPAGSVGLVDLVAAQAALAVVSSIR